MTHNTREVEEKFLIKFVIDIVWEATDGGVKMTPNQFSHFGEPLSALTEFQTYLHHQLQKARHDWLREEIVRLEGMKREIDYIPTPHGYDVNERDFGFNQALQTIIDRYQEELDQPTEDKKYCNGEPCICGGTNTNQLKV